MKYLTTVLGTFFILVCISIFIPKSFGTNMEETTNEPSATIMLGEAEINSPADINEYLFEVYGE
jgi:hypothetical protein